MNRQDILDAYPDQNFLFADGFDDAILGVDEPSGRLINSVKRCIGCLVRDGVGTEFLDEAVEYFDFNTRGAYVGELTPIWCDDMFTV